MYSLKVATYALLLAATVAQSQAKSLMRQERRQAQQRITPDASESGAKMGIVGATAMHENVAVSTTSSHQGQGAKMGATAVELAPVLHENVAVSATASHQGQGAKMGTVELAAVELPPVLHDNVAVNTMASSQSQPVQQEAAQASVHTKSPKGSRRNSPANTSVRALFAALEAGEKIGKENKHTRLNFVSFTPTVLTALSRDAHTCDGLDVILEKYLDRHKELQRKGLTRQSCKNAIYGPQFMYGGNWQPDWIQLDQCNWSTVAQSMQCHCDHIDACKALGLSEFDRKMREDIQSNSQRRLCELGYRPGIDFVMIGDDAAWNSTSLAETLLRSVMTKSAEDVLQKVSNGTAHGSLTIGMTSETYNFETIVINVHRHFGDQWLTCPGQGVEPEVIRLITLHARDVSDSFEDSGSSSSPSPSPTPSPTLTMREDPAPSPTPTPTPPTELRYRIRADPCPDSQEGGISYTRIGAQTVYIGTSVPIAQGGTNAGRGLKILSDTHCNSPATAEDCEWIFEESNVTGGLFYIKAPDQATYWSAPHRGWLHRRIAMSTAPRKGTDDEDMDYARFDLDFSSTRTQSGGLSSCMQSGIPLNLIRIADSKYTFWTSQPVYVTAAPRGLGQYQVADEGDQVRTYKCEEDDDFSSCVWQFERV